MGTKEELKEERDKIVKGLEETYKRLLIFKKQKNSPMIVIRDGKIQAVDPNDLEPTIFYRRVVG
jgi:imidazolonepropionase-like amidohydrolase